MRALFFTGIVMASGLLGLFGGNAAETGKAGAPKPPAMKMEAPSTNPLDAVMDDIYRREMAGEIDHGQALDIYGEAIKSATPEQLEEHHRNMDKRR